MRLVFVTVLLISLLVSCGDTAKAPDTSQLKLSPQGISVHEGKEMSSASYRLVLTPGAH